MGKTRGRNGGRDAGRMRGSAAPMGRGPAWMGGKAGCPAERRRPPAFMTGRRRKDPTGTAPGRYPPHRRRWGGHPGALQASRGRSVKQAAGRGPAPEAEPSGLTLPGWNACRGIAETAGDQRGEGEEMRRDRAGRGQIAFQWIDRKVAGKTGIFRKSRKSKPWIHKNRQYFWGLMRNS